MKRAAPALRFLLAARQAELKGLEQLADTCAFVALISELIHALQKERGYSNLYVSLQGDALLTQLGTLSELAQAREHNVRVFLDSMDFDAGRARLFNRIAYALYRLDELPDLRWKIRQQKLGAAEASAVFTRLIANLLAVVFEAADASLDARITRLLVALLNFMQGKELAGQERAFGVTGYTAGCFDAAQKAQMAEFISGQQRSFDTFERYAPDDIRQAWQSASEHLPPVTQLRAMAMQTDASHQVDPELAKLWFELCTTRIDAMHPIASRLTTLLATQCRQSIVETREELHNHRLLQSRLDTQLNSHLPAMEFTVQGRALDQPPADGLGNEIERSVLDILQAQTEQMQRADVALRQARSTLDEQKDIQRAKRLLMKAQHLSEPAAHARLQQAAMDSGRPLLEIARQLLETHHF